MTVAVEAIYENGVLRPDKPLGFKEHSKVRVIVEDESEARAAAEDDDPTGWKAADELIGFIKGGLKEPVGEEHDKHLYHR